MKSSLALCLFLITFTLSAQIRQTNADTTDGDVIIIDHFGKLIEDRAGSESIKWISQGLQLRIDSTNIYADSAVIYAEDRVFAYKDVVIQQGDSLNVFTDTLKYFRERDVAYLTGEVALRQGSRQLWTNGLTYFLGARYGEYNHGGVLIDKSLQVSSKRGIYWAGRREVMFRDSVVVLHPKFTLAADSMRYLAAISRVIFTGPTNIYTKAAKIYCEGGFYDLKTETAEFNRNPQYAGNRKNATADTIRYTAKTGEVEMLGNVIVKDENRVIRGNYLRYLENTGETWIKGNPAIYSDSVRTINSPEIFYNEKTNQVTTKGESEISAGDLIMKSKQFDFDQVTGIGRAIGNVEWRDTVKDFGIISDTLDFSQKTEYLLAYGASRPLFYSIVDGDTLFISADTLNMWTIIDTMPGFNVVPSDTTEKNQLKPGVDSILILDQSAVPPDSLLGVEQEAVSGTVIKSDTLRMMKAYHDVRLYKSNMQGLADSLVFHGLDSVFTFYGNPVLWSDTTQFTSDTMQMHLQNKKIKDIVLTRRALIVSEIMNVFYDQIKGKSIVADFDSNAIKEMLVTGNAESIYYTKDDREAFIGVNRTICSKMLFTFTDGQIHLLKYFGDNSSTLSPMNEVNHDTLRLDGFIWREEERPMSVNDLLK